MVRAGLWEAGGKPLRLRQACGRWLWFGRQAGRWQYWPKVLEFSFGFG